jgi:hypothetical protein
MRVPHPFDEAAQPGKREIVLVEQFALRGNLFEGFGPMQIRFRVPQEHSAQCFQNLLLGFAALPQGLCLAAQFVEFFVDFVERRFIFHEGSPVKWLGLQIGCLPAHFNDAG